MNVRITKDKKSAQGIFEISDQWLLTPDMIKNKVIHTDKLPKDQGFVVGKHNLKKIETWIGNDRNEIVIATEKENVVGFIITLGTDDIIKEVQNYAIGITFSDKETRKIIGSGNFKYLIQIAVHKDYTRRGVASKMVEKLYANCEVPIISFVVKSPVENIPSLNWHLKNSFELFGIYIGEFGKFENYQSHGLVHK